MYILSIHQSHDASMSLIKDGEVILNLAHERLSHTKHCRQTYEFSKIIRKYTDYVDKIVISRLHNSRDEFNVIEFAHMCGIKYGELLDYSPFHHRSHAYLAFKHSGFNNAITIVLDGAGSEKPDIHIHGAAIKECESVFSISKHMFECIHKSYVGPMSSNFEFPDEIGCINTRIGLGLAYNGVTGGIGFIDCGEEGKTMGLSAYATEEQINSIPRLVGPYGADEDKFRLYRGDGILGYCAAIIDIPKELYVEYAGRIQRDFEEYIINLVRYYISKTGCKNIVLSGGCFLNCVANYKLRKSLPADVNIFVEPISGDDGIALGNAFMVDDLEDLDNHVNRKLTTLYLGGKLEYEYSLNDGESEASTTSKEVAQLISEGNCVAIAQGRSESGPRALGNRSILFDPRDKDGKDKVNKIKKREYFRPFAATVLYENCQQWFDMSSLDESPYMTYAVDVLPGKSDEIPAVTHVNNTCRIQTLKSEQNKNYYELIDEFYKLTDVPMVLNTSFNLAGDTMVETIEDALRTLRFSELEYLYLPEIQKLIHIPKCLKINESIE